ncbi:hypothetical protein [Inhella gelatinilytica]|uniref:Uncharacterized protein n=1 Tax=Inhella gelatinilytica TaxID=2795030 RepID=A0A931NFK9_9BURK|nr:hypothetical protein [Inhella gelatinilytica]MBH9553656.1 hypothetical protein [Inhella gelatinilytica]
MKNNSIEVGRFFVSPMIKRDVDGQFVASVSIRSGQGRATTDRVTRFEPRFACAQSALRFAVDRGIAWARLH